jgi:phenylacetate-coenzyme A ligase PaaK-like adenylate-forming protein
MILFKLVQAIQKRRDTLKLSPELREARNLARFRELVAFVQENSPWYRRIIKENQIDPAQCRPEDFPVLTSAIFKENFDQILTDRNITRKKLDEFIRDAPKRDLYLGRYHVVLSSGSSGVPSVFVHTTDEVINGMSYGALHRQVKLRTRTSFIGPVDAHDMGAAVMGLMDNWPQRLLFNTRNFDISMPWAEIITGLNEHQPKTISGYKHYLMALADEARAGNLKIRPNLIESGGEPLFPHEREILRSTFRCEIANSYGSSEVNLMGVALNDWEGIYLFEDDLIFELGPEATCVTNLFNRTMPLIRYQFDDILVPVEVSNPRMPFRVVSECIGRSQEMITFEIGEGEKRRFRTVFFDEGIDLSGVKRIQWQKVNSETLSVRIAFVEVAELQKLSGVISASERLEQLRAVFRQHLDDNDLKNVRLEMSEVDGGAEAEARIVRTGRKEKSVLR